MTKHTPEKWQIVLPYQIGTAVLDIAIMGHGQGKEIAQANAQRIVACVNALEGIPTEKLETLLATGATVTQVLNNMIGLADEYATALDADIDERNDEGDDDAAVDALIERGQYVNTVMKRACDVIGIKYIAIRSTPSGDDDPGKEQLAELPRFTTNCGITYSMLHPGQTLLSATNWPASRLGNPLIIPAGATGFMAETNYEGDLTSFILLDKAVAYPGLAHMEKGRDTFWVNPEWLTMEDDND